MFSLCFPFFFDGFPSVFWFCFLRFLWVSLVCPTLSLFCVFLIVLVHVMVLPSFLVHILIFMSFSFVSFVYTSTHVTSLHDLI